MSIVQNLVVGICAFSLGIRFPNKAWIFDLMAIYALFK